MRKDRINYDIEPDLHDYVKKCAKESNLSRNQVISKALRYWMEIDEVLGGTRKGDKE